jgi:hypothetical protein
MGSPKLVEETLEETIKDMGTFHTESGSSLDWHVRVRVRLEGTL